MRSSNSHKHHWILKLLAATSKPDVWEQKPVWLFCYSDFERIYEVLKSKSLCILLNKNINFNKNETESKMENPTQSFRETNLVLQVIQELQMKSKTVMSWSSQKKKRGIFCTVYFSEQIFFEICVLYQCIVCWIHFQNMRTFTYTYFTCTLLLLVSKIVESLQCILSW